MNFNEYQEKARTTAIYKHPIMYPALGLAGETGEVCEKIKKAYRDIDGFNPNIYKTEFPIKDLRLVKLQEEIKKELGDVTWYLANLAADFNLNLDEIAETNLQKLFSRKERGVLQGSGDDR